MYVVLIGPPGCGKGTQSQRLTELLGVPHLSTGEMLRAAMQQDTSLGRRVAACVEGGGLASDELIIEMTGQRLSQADCARGCLLDGVPRTLRQAQDLDRLLAERGQAIDVAIELQADRDELIRRLLQRAQTEGRTDDNRETIQRRMEVYQSQTAPILDFYRQQAKLRPVEGMGTPEEVFDRIRTQLGRGG